MKKVLSMALVAVMTIGLLEMCIRDSSRSV